MWEKANVCHFSPSYKKLRMCVSLREIPVILCAQLVSNCSTVRKGSIWAYLWREKDITEFMKKQNMIEETQNHKFSHNCLTDRGEN